MVMDFVDHLQIHSTKEKQNARLGEPREVRLSISFMFYISQFLQLQGHLHFTLHLIFVRHEITYHKCSYMTFVDIIKVLKLIERKKQKILSTPFSHFLEFKSKIIVDNSLLDDCCRCWVSRDTFLFGQSFGTKVHFTTSEVGEILNIPHGGRPMDFKRGDYKTTFYHKHLYKYMMNRCP